MLSLSYHATFLIYHIWAPAWWASEKELFLVDQAVDQILLTVVMVDLQKGHDCDTQPSQPGRPQPKLEESRGGLTVIFMIKIGNKQCEKQNLSKQTLQVALSGSLQQFEG